MARNLENSCDSLPPAIFTVEVDDSKDNCSCFETCGHGKSAQGQSSSPAFPPLLSPSLQFPLELKCPTFAPVRKPIAETINFEEYVAFLKDVPEALVRGRARNTSPQRSEGWSYTQREIDVILDKFLAEPRRISPPIFDFLDENVDITDNKFYDKVYRRSGHGFVRFQDYDFSAEFAIQEYLKFSLSENTTEAKGEKEDDEKEEDEEEEKDGGEQAEDEEEIIGVMLERWTE